MDYRDKRGKVQSSCFQTAAVKQLNSKALNDLPESEITAASEIYETSLRCSYMTLLSPEILQCFNVLTWLYNCVIVAITAKIRMKLLFFDL